MSDIETIEVDVLGPYMRELNERQQRFVLAQFQDSPFKGKGQLVYWARAAGYSGDEKTLQSTAGRLLADEKIQLARDEVARQQKHVLAPLAFTALRKLLQTPSHKDHARGIEMILSRIDPVESKHTVSVQHQTEITPQMTEAVLKRMDEIAARLRYLCHLRA